jgi:ketose-bisphosphate aldolase
MPLEDVRTMAKDALERGYAIGYLDAWNLESLQGVLDAAESTRSPIIIGFNGEFLSDPNRPAIEQLEIYAGLGRAAAGATRVPCALIFNECSRDEWVRQAIEAGFNLVMPVMPGVEFEECVRRVARLATVAHDRGAAIEGEIGELPCGIPGTPAANGRVTEPEGAAEFVERADVDLLAVSVGNVHIRIEGTDDLDLERLAEIHRRVTVPLVLHGGSGISRESLQAAIGLGVAKVNYGTYVKQRYLKAVSRALSNAQSNPHELLGMGGEQDVMVAGRAAVREAVLERLDWLGCCGKA